MERAILPRIMTDKIIVFVTCESREQAEKIAESVVTDKFAACVNILPGVRSCYVWQRQLTWSNEVVCLIKTTRGRFAQLEERIKSLHSYEVPEIAAVTIEDVYKRYAEWIDESVGG
jgi:periplasmic divalent cation tolerance protein